MSSSSPHDDSAAMGDAAQHHLQPEEPEDSPTSHIKEALTLASNRKTGTPYTPNMKKMAAKSPSLWDSRGKRFVIRQRFRQLLAKIASRRKKKASPITPARPIISPSTLGVDSRQDADLTKQQLGNANSNEGSDDNSPTYTVIEDPFVDESPIVRVAKTASEGKDGDSSIQGQTKAEPYYCPEEYVQPFPEEDSTSEKDDDDEEASNKQHSEASKDEGAASSGDRSWMTLPAGTPIVVDWPLLLTTSPDLHGRRPMDIRNKMVLYGNYDRFAGGREFEVYSPAHRKPRNPHPHHYR
ncbi:hypothetical protein MKZ38_002830 [Zalerion maritima]|uniref:Uncharacterized protein n=1 Tax=Zalerion maritima TaxID=339359 RepID=A0AAD5WS67_9PEZI|nr:hypothetical protein MKZ38_002830 [Zalerion maritima]